MTQRTAGEGVDGSSGSSSTTRERRALSGAVSYALASGCEAVLQIVVVPFITRAVSVSVFGQFALIYVSIPIFMLLADGGTSLAVVRYLARNPDAADQRRLVSSYFWPRVAVAPVIAALAWAVASMLPLDKMAGPGTRAALPFVAVMFVSGTLFDACMEALRGQERHKEVSLALFLRATSRAAALILFVVVWHLGVPGIFGALTVANVLGLAIGAQRLGKKLGSWPDWRLYLLLLKFGLPTVMMFVTRAALDLDRYLVSALTSVSTAGLYQLAGVPAMGVEMINRVGAFPIEPYVYGGDPAKRARAFVQVTRLFMYAVAGTAITLSVFGPELLRLLAPPTYASAITALPALLFAMGAAGTFRIVGLGAGVVRKPRAWAFASISELVTSTTLMIFVARPLGFGGIAMMRLVGAFVGLLVCYQLARAAWPVRLPVLRGIVFFGISAVCATVTTGGFGAPALPLGQRILVWLVLIGLGALTFLTFPLPSVGTGTVPEKSSLPPPA